ncbi:MULTISPECIES: Holliday junction resolvase RuvX [Sporomusaceae]|uniref:Holliday junction resolvase RuvX n=1 Tax=Sporomusaceae TaxID=1843490 RepID=UPI00036052D4|nr:MULTISPECIES: Holliday junction resolvase RuvX [Sporomusaceae]
MRSMGLDVGDRTIGVAVSDLLALTAQGVEVIRRTSPQADFARLAALCQEYEVGTIVVGLPKNMNGTLGPRGELVQEFAAQLQEQLPEAKIVFWDERLSTVAAEKALIEADVRRNKRRKVIDKMAAIIILQGWMDLQSRSG